MFVQSFTMYSFAMLRLMSRLHDMINNEEIGLGFHLMLKVTLIMVRAQAQDVHIFSYDLHRELVVSTHTDVLRLH